MGNHESGGKGHEKAKHYGGIYLKADKPYWNPGEQFTGTIFLSLTKTFPGGKLFMELVGQESYQYLETKSKVDENNQPVLDENQQQVIEYILKEDKKVIMDVKIPIYKAGHEFPPGQYAFPFSFLLPPGIPGSFYQEANMCVAEIEYKLKAVLDPDDSHAPKLKHKEKLIINENLTKSGGNSLLSKAFDVSTCFCCGKGKAEIAARFEKDYLVPGESGKMYFSVDSSKCSLDCSDISLVIVETLTIGKQTFQQTPASTTIPGFAQGEVIKEKLIEVPLPNYNPLAFKKKNLEMDKNIEELKEKKFGHKELVPSVNGKLVKAEYKMSLRLNYGGCACGDYGVSVPVQIYCPPAKVLEVQAPPNWQPQMMPIANVTISPEFARKGGNGGNFAEYKGHAQPGGHPQMNIQMTPQQPLIQQSHGGGH